jgi:limonene-1,2-epoxide hydrolase
MTDEITSMSRRSAFAAAGLGALLAGGLGARGAMAAEMTAEEKANVKVVDDFMQSWAKPDIDAAKLAAFLTDDCVLRMQEDKPAITGKAAAAEAMGKLLVNDMRFGIVSHTTFARGPLVANDRTDWVINKGVKGASFGVAGVFVVRGGKIKEWSDYVLKA